MELELKQSVVREGDGDLSKSQQKKTPVDGVGRGDLTSVFCMLQVLFCMSRSSITLVRLNPRM